MDTLAPPTRSPFFRTHVSSKPTGNKAKRAMDIALAMAGIFLLAPLLIICSLSIMLTSPGPVLFRHRRVGFQRAYFNCLKFRTMVVDSERLLQAYFRENPQAIAEWAATRKLRFDPRVTAIGTILRRTSLDELPQLFNVLKGDMSIVGPRPVTEEELGRYCSNIKWYLACRPGITGLWQVSGRSKTTYRKRVACDAYYARHWSLALDTKIISATLPALLESDSAF